ncbi:zinc finger CCCH domain-containing protein 11A-like [Octodon degus]|uniref:Zinc finger CCCH domain-containing protein 11A-like n=1 Tax=Octodon degus TaxID=10160 RepID=A0A6P3EGY5_OCTDE|nr:zinc finger CCCH domain-containing protein 11A-like [Octodon degus]
MQAKGDPGVPCPRHLPGVISVTCGNEDDPDLSSKEAEQTNTHPPGCTPQVPGGLQMNSTQKPGVTLQQAAPSAVSNPVLQPQLLPAVVRTVTVSSKGEPLVRLSLSERLGKRKLSASGECDPPLRRSLSERLGKEVGAPETDLDKAAKKSQISKSLQEPIMGASPGPRRREAAMRGDKAGDIHVKTLEEILAGRVHQKHAELHTKLKTRSTSAAEGPTSRARTLPSTQMKTLSEGLAENEYRQQEKARQQCRGHAKHMQEEQERGGTREGKSALPPLREDVASGSTLLEKPVLTAEAGLPPCLTEQLPTGSCQKEEGETSDPGHQKPKRKRAPQSLASKGKADRKGNGKPSGVKVLSSPPLAPKRKASELHAEGEVVAAGELLSSTSTLQGPPAKKAALTTVAPFLEHRPVPEPEMEKPRDSLELSPRQSSPHLPSLRGFGPYSFQMATDSCKASSASMGEVRLCKEDDFEELLLEISGDKLEDAIDLDLEKDESELLIELFELIDN